MRFLFVGHTVGVKFCIEKIQADTQHSVIAVYTHKKELHKYDLDLFEMHKTLWGDFAYDVFDVVNDFNIPVVEYEDINSEATISEITAYKPDCIVTIGCRDIFKRKLIDSVAFCINLHPFNIPYWRGGGIDSWMILNGAWNSTQYATAHFISERLDAGNIISKMPYFIDPNSYPLDIFKRRIRILGDLLIESVSKLKNGFQGMPQDNDQSYYFPKLFTPRDGELKLSWSGEEIMKFIYAFGYPYSGAFLHYEDFKISILEAEYIAGDSKHPFAVGLIFRKNKDSFNFFVKDGYIVVMHWVVDEDCKIKIGKFYI
jgi:methionyl-tRNA formyltransferase